MCFEQQIDSEWTQLNLLYETTWDESRIDLWHTFYLLEVAEGLEAICSNSTGQDWDSEITRPGYLFIDFSSAAHFYAYYSFINTILFLSSLDGRYIEPSRQLHLITLQYHGGRINI